METSSEEFQRKAAAFPWKSASLDHDSKSTNEVKVTTPQKPPRRSRSKSSEGTATTSSLSPVQTETTVDAKFQLPTIKPAPSSKPRRNLQALRHSDVITNGHHDQSAAVVASAADLTASSGSGVSTSSGYASEHNTSMRLFSPSGYVARRYNSPQQLLSDADTSLENVTAAAKATERSHDVIAVAPVMHVDAPVSGDRSAAAHYHHVSPEGGSSWVKAFDSPRPFRSVAHASPTFERMSSNDGNAGVAVRGSYDEDDVVEL